MAAETTVRVTQETREKLLSYTKRLAADVARRPWNYPDWMKEGRFSISTAIAWLMAMQEGHIERARASRKRVAKRKAEEVRYVLAPETDSSGADGNLGAESVAPPT